MLLVRPLIIADMFFCFFLRFSFSERMFVVFKGAIMKGKLNLKGKTIFENTNFKRENEF